MVRFPGSLGAGVSFCSGSGPVLVRFWSGSGPVLVRFWSGSAPVLLRFCSGSATVFARLFSFLNFCKIVAFWLSFCEVLAMSKKVRIFASSFRREWATLGSDPQWPV